MRRIAVLATAALFLVTLPALAEDDPAGGTDAAGVAVTDSLNPFLTTTQAGDYVAAGVGMRGTGSGTITISGIPAGAAVTNAFLYWAILGTTPAPASFANGLFDGNPITGTQVGSGPDTCWGGVDTTFAFRADVTALVPGNGSYSLTGFATGPSFSTPPLNEGASLVVLYTDPAATELRDIVIYDGADIIEFAVASVSTNMAVPSVAGFGSAKTTYVVGDGQDVFSDDTLFNGVIIASDAPGFGDTTSLEGSDGPLWDTDTYAVTGLISAGDTSVNVRLQRGSDCLAHVAQVFSNSARLIVAHFKCYEADGEAVDVTVDLEDQFGVEPQVLVGEPELFCNPVAKTHAGEVTEIGDPTAHLTAYEIEDDEDVERQVIVSNQFGDEQTLQVEGPGFLFVPSEKDGVGSDLRLDHFKCYEADGEAVDVTVDLEDQFGVELQVLVGEPELFCNPVAKTHNGEVTEVLTPESHLTCYEIENDGDDEERDVLAGNQFGDQTLEVEEPELLCVPSEKVAVQLEDDVDEDD